jgi:glucose-6-phosphate 1-epimerase
VAADGARLRLLPHGGHVTSWAPAGGDERLWLSRATGCGPGVAVRGGVPVVWPQFSGRGPLPKHGFARDRAWSLVSAAVGADGAAEATLVLGPDGGTRALWPHEFALSLLVRASGDALVIALGVANAGTSAFSFTAALHAYLAVPDPDTARIEGVGGHRAEDNADGGRERHLPPGPLRPAGPVDLAVRAARGPVRLVTPGRPDLEIDREGLPDLVVWNPGRGLAPGDVHPGGESEFVCVEPAVLDAVTLEPGQKWHSRAEFRQSGASAGNRMNP